MTTEKKPPRFCADCGADVWARGGAKRCKPCSSAHYDKMQSAKAKATKLRRAQLRVGGG